MPLAARPAILSAVAWATDDNATPISAREFAARMQRLGPFEDRPHLVVGVSGGRDSLALALLAAEWAAARDGRVTGVTVDHGLRASSGAEAAQVSEWMAQHGIPHHTLRWHDSPGPDPERLNGSASEAAARSARYALLEAFCRAQAALHLLVGHHRDDQLETQAMRRARSSGAYGRAGMPAVRELPQARILRPFLDIRRARITATVRAHGQDWIEDPSNHDTRFARARMRTDPSAIPSSRPDAGMARVAAERTIARIAAHAVAVHPAGFATLDPALLDAVDRATGTRLIGNLVTCIGGQVYAPRGTQLSRLAGRLMDGDLGGGATLGGCILRSDGRGMVRIIREQAAIEAPRSVDIARDSGRAFFWDGRFHVSVPTTGRAGMTASSDAEIQLGAVGSFTARGVPLHSDSPRYETLPGAVRMALPAIYRDGQFCICAMPFGAETGLAAAKARFAPKKPVAGAVFATG